MEGLASYLAEDEDDLDRMAIRDAVVNNILPPIQALNVVTFLTYRYGHAIFDYIEQEHGKEGLRSFLFEYRKVLLSNNLEKAFKEAFGYGLDEFNRRFNRYLRRKYFPVLMEKKSPDEIATEIGVKKPGVFTFSPVISPSGELVAVLASPKMELDLFVLSADDGSKVKNLTKGFTNTHRGLVANAFKGRRDLSWSPTADEIAVFARSEDKWPILIYHAISGKRLRRIVLDDIVECSSPAYSPDGRRIAFEGNRHGVVDLFEYDLDTGEVRNLTQDSSFDANPWYAADGKSLLYNRRIGSHWKIFSVDLSDPGLKQQLTFGPSSDIQPSYSRDGKTIYFSANRGEYGVFNIWALDLATGNLTQYTDVVGGTFAPVEMAQRGGDPHLVFTAYFDGQFRLYRMPLLEPVDEIDVAEQLVDPIEVERFEPPLTLKVDDELKKPYKLKWDIEAPSVYIGYADDGTLLSDVAVQFSDLMGNHRARVQAFTVRNYANYVGTYFNLRRRFNWGVSLYHYADFYLSTGGEDQTNKRTGTSAFISYPFSRHYRLDLNVGIQETQQDVFVGNNPSSGQAQFDKAKDIFGSVNLAYVGDTVRYQSFGPFQGKRFSVGGVYAPHISGDLPGDIVQYELDYRAYRKITRRSVLAFRLAGIYNDGDRSVAYGFGGMNQLRGYDFREFVGSRISWANLEFRFPLIDRLDFPIMRLGQIRGFFFLDVGGAWNLDDSWWDPRFGFVRRDSVQGNIDFDPWDSENNRLQDIRATWGVGLQFIFLGGLQFNWAWTNPLEYTQYCPVTDLVNCTYGGAAVGSVELEKVRINPESKLQFYIAFDF
jgi:Tol biopolymer transport system component